MKINIIRVSLILDGKIVYAEDKDEIIEASLLEKYRRNLIRKYAGVMELDISFKNVKSTLITNSNSV